MVTGFFLWLSPRSSSALRRAVRPHARGGASATRRRRRVPPYATSSSCMGNSSAPTATRRTTREPSSSEVRALAEPLEPYVLASELSAEARVRLASVGIPEARAGNSVDVVYYDRVNSDRLI